MPSGRTRIESGGWLKRARTMVTSTTVPPPAALGPGACAGAARRHDAASA